MARRQLLKFLHVSYKYRVDFFAWFYNTESFFFACHKNRVDFCKLFTKTKSVFMRVIKNRVDFCNGPIKRDIILKQTAHQANVLVFANNRPIKISIMILKQVAHQANGLIFAEN